MCLESCFECQEPCWNTNYLPEVSNSGPPADESKRSIISAGPPNHTGLNIPPLLGDPYPAGDLQESPIRRWYEVVRD